MKIKINEEDILKPISGDNRAGEDLRYTKFYEDIKEARRYDDPLEMGEWKRELKKADWEKVISLSVEALTKKTKDLQIAAWLCEALIIKEGYEGLVSGLRIINGLLDSFWDELYPNIDDGDLEFRAAPLEFLNEKLWARVKEIPVTDPGAKEAYSWFRWQESREVGYESDTLNKYGDVDENKKQKRDELISEGKITGEDFDSAFTASSPGFYKNLAISVEASLEEFNRLDSIVDARFGNDAPRLAEFGDAVKDCYELVMRLAKEKGVDIKPKDETASKKEEETKEEVKIDESRQGVPQRGDKGEIEQYPEQARHPLYIGSETEVWEEALNLLESKGLKYGLERLFEASLGAPSVRDKSRYKLLMAKLCIKGERIDLAKPIVEELNGLIDELHLDRWESPIWIADVLEALYSCLVWGEPSDEDMGRARALLQRICTMDVTRAIAYKA